MLEHIKTIKNFNSVENINSIIESWAQNNGFYEDIPTIKSFTDYNNIVYCFKSLGNEESVLLTINILDDKVHMETWAVSPIDKHTKQRQQITNLLTELGQKPI